MSDEITTEEFSDVSLEKAAGDQVQGAADQHPFGPFREGICKRGFDAAAGGGWNARRAGNVGDGLQRVGHRGAGHGNRMQFFGQPGEGTQKAGRIFRLKHRDDHVESFGRERPVMRRQRLARAADHQRCGKRPGLRGDVADFTDRHARFLHHFAAHRFLHRLARLHEPREEGVHFFWPE